MGKRLNGGDKIIKREDLRVMERRINEHSKMWTKIVNAGEFHGHNSRIRCSKTIESEVAASKYFMYKDHKGGETYQVVAQTHKASVGYCQILWSRCVWPLRIPLK